jgi:cytochrome c oxidase subunit 4
MDSETAAPVPQSVLDGATEEYPRERQYVITAIILAGITFVEVMTYYVPDLPVWHWSDTNDFGIITVLLILMAVKFFIVAYIFMHLKFDKPLLTRVFYGGLLLAVGVYVAVLTMFNLWWAGHSHP